MMGPWRPDLWRRARRGHTACNLLEFGSLGKELELVCGRGPPGGTALLTFLCFGAFGRGTYNALAAVVAPVAPVISAGT